METNPDIFVVVNPASGGGRAARAEPAVAATLAAAGRSAKFVHSRSTDDIHELAARAAAEGFRYVAALGGDGALHHLIEGVIGKDVVVGFFPAGNGNDIARALGIPNHPVEAAKAFLRGAPRAVDVVRVRSGGGLTAHFIGAGGLGMDAEAAYLANTRFKSWPGTSRYLAGMMQAYFGGKLWKLSAQIDGLPWSGEVLFAAVANGNSYGSGLHIAAEAEMDDGWLDIVLVGAIRLRRLLKAIPIVLTSGDLRSFPELQRFRCRKISMQTDRVARLHGDGEDLGESPAEFKVMPGAVRIIAGK
ncbi:MAG TPA: diacylglycerol kinase family protein [Candidatus Acidoferrales bacterium]